MPRLLTLLCRAALCFGLGAFGYLCLFAHVAQQRDTLVLRLFVLTAACAVGLYLSYRKGK